MSKGNDEPHKQQVTLQDHILYIVVGNEVYTAADLEKEKDGD
jgi:hypothetical protein